MQLRDLSTYSILQYRSETPVVGQEDPWCRFIDRIEYG